MYLAGTKRSPETTASDEPKPKCTRGFRGGKFAPWHSLMAEFRRQGRHSAALHGRVARVASECDEASTSFGAITCLDIKHVDTCESDFVAEVQSCRWFDRTAVCLVRHSIAEHDESDFVAPV